MDILKDRGICIHVGTSTRHAPSAVPEQSRSAWASAELLILLAVLAAYIGWMLSMPCFPTADGPVHMYYVHVLDALLFHSNPEYMQYFRIRHLLPPYSLYYYALLVGSKFMPMLLVDRLIICFYFLSFTFGFRYLARAIGPFADYATLLATPLLLNWPLGMGFVNFCLSLSFSFWAIGIWLRMEGRRSLKRRIAFLLLVTVVMLTHPVPLLLLLAVTGTVLLLRVWHASRGTGAIRLPAFGKEDLLTWAVAALNVGYVKLFARTNPFKQDQIGEPISYWSGMVHRASIYSREHALAVVLGRGTTTLVYRAALLTLLFGCMALAIRQRMRNRAGGVWTAGDSFLLLGGILFLGVPFIPDQLNGLYHFADRLVLCVWLAFLLAASGWSARAGDDISVSIGPDQQGASASGRERLPVSVGLAVVVFVVVANASVLHSINRLLRPTAESIYALEHVSLPSTGQMGFVLEDGRKPTTDVHENVSWEPFYWAAIHVFRYNDAVLANAPWMDETILPVAASSALPEMAIPVLGHPFPSQLEKMLLAHPEQLRETLMVDTFFVVNQHGRSVATGSEPLLQIPEAAEQHWSCSYTGSYRICQRPTTNSLK